MRLLLDEMISFRIAAELRSRGHDVQAIKRDRPDLESAPDLAIVRQLAAEERTLVTNNVKDFLPLHSLIAAGERHAGLVFSHDGSLPRTKAAVGLWVEVLEALLAAEPARGALQNQFRHIL